MHRWQQGYALTETMREWGHLEMCLLAEIDRYCLAHPDIEEEVAATARRESIRLANDGVTASAARYSQLQRTEAASRLHDLEQALEELRTLGFQRIEAWREAAHDLRGNAHVIVNAAALLNREDVPDSRRLQVSEALSNAASNLSTLLSDLLDHARLEADRNADTFSHSTPRS